MSTEVLSTTTTIAKSEKQIQKQLKEKEKKQKKKERKKQQKIEKQIKQESSDNEDTKDFESNSEQQPQIEIEYVNEDLNSELDPSLLGEYQDIFSKFQTKEAPSETEDAEKVEQAEGEENGEEEEENQLSKKKKKKMIRMPIALLKQLAKRPDLIETWDTTSTDPLLLLDLKATRNGVPVPRHWNAKRKFLQGKRGIEKPPFHLPEFIAATGITQLRQSVKEKEDAKKSATKMREKANPKLGRMDIDYQVLHDAFFKYQTKPKLSIHGDIYYEGKEFELPIKDKKPGKLSEEIKKALGMPEGAPPPWLLNMQRFGPPPSYPSLKVPGLNAPIPEGARYGFHAGGWGKPPVDEFGRPLYGDVFGTEVAPPPEISEPIEKKLWGEIEDVPQEDEPQLDLNPEDEQQELTESQEKTGLETPSGMETPAGIETPATLELRKAGLDTPQTPMPDLELRKGPIPKKPNTNTNNNNITEEEKKELYQIVRQESSTVGNSLMGSSFKYVMPGQEQPKQPEKREIKNKDRIVPMMKSQAGAKMDVALTTEEVENLEGMSEDLLKKKYEAAMNEQKNANKPEDVSDVIEEYSKKRKAEEKSQDKNKKFKF